MHSFVRYYRGIIVPDCVISGFQAGDIGRCPVSAHGLVLKLVFIVCGCVAGPPLSCCAIGCVCAGPLPSCEGCRAWSSEPSANVFFQGRQSKAYPNHWKVLGQEMTAFLKVWTNIWRAVAPLCAYDGPVTSPPCLYRVDVIDDSWFLKGCIPWGIC